MSTGRQPGCWFRACYCAAVASADRIEQHFKVEAHPVVTIHNPNGTVTVRAWTKSDVMVVAKRATTEVEVDAEQTGNRVDVQTRQVADTASPDDLRTDFEISVPEDAELANSQRFGRRQRLERARRHERGNHRSGRGSGRHCRISDGQDRRRLVPMPALRWHGSKLRSISGNFKLIDLRSYLRPGANLRRKHSLQRLVPAEWPPTS